MNYDRRHLKQPKKKHFLSKKAEKNKSIPEIIVYLSIFGLICIITTMKHL